MRHQTQQVLNTDNKSADSILDEFLHNQSNKQPTKSFIKRSPLESTKLKVPSPTNSKPFASQQQQNLLFSISGREDSFQQSNGHNTTLESATSQLAQLQRKLIGFFFVYATIIITLYLTYAVYSYYQQSQFSRRQQQFVESASFSSQANGGAAPASSLVVSANSDEQQTDQETMRPILEVQTKLEGKIHLLERYIEMLALDLEDTKGRLKEREKCGCSIACSFNGTRFSDGQRWQQKCDICTCQAGKISCLPRECPKLADCADPVQLPGRCCPTCMKKCKVNNGLVRHGHSFRPSNQNGALAGKQCKCLDGLIKCEPLQPSPFNHAKAQPLPGAVKNRTLEYLKSILGAANSQMKLQPDDDDDDDKKQSGAKLNSDVASLHKLE